MPIGRLISVTPTQDLNVRYLYYLLSGITIGGDRGGVPQLTVPNLRKTVVPVPSLDAQMRVVAALDSFDALLNDLSIGLPAELAARRQQYEYYRDRLLTFKEAVA